MTNRISTIKSKFINANSKLIALNPMAVLSRGYGAVLNESNNVVKSIDDVNVDDSITVMLKDGNLTALVQKKNRSKNNA